MYIYDRSRSKKEHIGKSARIFVCGPTVYDYMHIGHARLFIIVDTLVRYLRYRGICTNLLVNITDIDPKIDEKASREGKDARAVSSYYSDEMLRDLMLTDSLHRIDAFAYVSDYVPKANLMIRSLLDKGYAYRLRNRVYLDVNTAYTNGYGSVSNSSIQDIMFKPLDMVQGKKNASDILLGYCRDGVEYPYWHMQDTSVAVSNYPDGYDLHIGSRDLAYPHHDAHLAQCRLLTDGKYEIRVFMHLGLLNIKGKKMSKSYNNTVRLRDTILRYGRRALRLYILSRHYGQDMEFDEDLLNLFRELAITIEERLRDSRSESNGKYRYVEEFREYMDDDLATDKVVYMISEHINDISSAELRIIDGVLF
jgi:cysteinyl-tRNA synthetase